MRSFEATLNRVLDQFFHLPTLLTIALIGLVLVWEIYDVGLQLGPGFVRLNSNQGNINLYWQHGCCELDW